MVDKINLISEIVKEGGATEYILELIDDINDGVTIVENNGQFDDYGYADFNLMGVANRAVIEANIAKRWGVEYEEGLLFTRSNKPRDFYNLLQAMLQSYAYVEFYRRGWIK